MVKSSIAEGVCVVVLSWCFSSTGYVYSQLHRNPPEPNIECRHILPCTVPITIPTEQRYRSVGMEQHKTWVPLRWVQALIKTVTLTENTAPDLKSRSHFGPREAVRLEKVDNLGVVFVFRVVDWKEALCVTQLRIRTVGQKKLHNVDPTVLGSRVEWCSQGHEIVPMPIRELVVVILNCIDVATFVEKHLDDIQTIRQCSTYGGMD